MKNKNFKKILKERIDMLSPDQLDLYNKMLKNNKLQICIPTGAGKGYLMMVHMLNRILNSNKINVITSHRLMLNSQHLDDLFQILTPVIGEIGFIFLGSSNYNSIKYQDPKKYPELNKALLEKGLSYNDLISSTTSKVELDSLIKFHKKNNRNVIVLTTYHSLFKLEGFNIGTIYNDEAHALASNHVGSYFQKNYEKIKYDNSYFFTATPKDSIEDSSSFLMNNEELFGKREGISFKEAINRGYVTEPAIHISYPEDFHKGVNYKSIENLVKLIKESFDVHRRMVYKNSFDPYKIQSKLLVRCASVQQMWDLQRLLNKELNNSVIVCASASSNPYSNYNNFIGSEGIKNRNDYLDRLQNLDSEAIVLHVDTMSEGINISSFTGVMFLSNILPTVMKIIQNVGRSTRINELDRARLIEGIISVDDRTKWIKPYSYVIIPIWDMETDYIAKTLSIKLKELRDELEFEPTYYVSIGNDVSESSRKEDEMDGLNLINKRKKSFELIENVKHEVEQLYQNEKDVEEKERLNKLSKLELLKEKFGK
jgi:hypothetical protein